MRWLAENALPIWIGGAIALTMASVVYFQTRSKGSLYGILGVISVTAALLLFNWFVETPREAVEHALYSLAAAVEANDVQAAIGFLAPTVAPNVRDLRKQIESELPQFKIERARVVGESEIEMDDDDKKATVKCRGLIVAVNRKDGMKGGAEDHATMEWVLVGNRWLLRDYVSRDHSSGAFRSPKSIGGSSIP